MPRSLLSFLLLLVGALLLAGCKTTRMELSPEYALSNLSHLQVRIRAAGTEFDLVTRVAEPDNLQKKFYECVEEVFRENGFEGELSYLKGTDEIILRSPALDVDVTRWERDSATAMECQVNARFITLEGEFIDMGRYYTSDVTLFKAGDKSREESFMDAGRAVARQLWRSLENARFVR